MCWPRLEDGTHRAPLLSQRGSIDDGRFREDQVPQPRSPVVSTQAHEPQAPRPRHVPSQHW